MYGDEILDCISVSQSLVKWLKCEVFQYFAGKVVRYFHSFQLEVRRHIWLLLDCRLGVFVGVCNVGVVWGVFSASVGRTLAHTSTK